MRLGAVLRTSLLFGLSLRLHHHFHGPPLDYGALLAAAAASWAGLPGPGESVLIAAGIFAARHRLDLASVLIAAWLGATGGGVIGWLVGLKGGRAIVMAPGPFRKMRLRAVARGDQVFARFPVMAILLTPSWIAGIHRVRPRLFLPVNALSATLWACGIGLGAYFAGPPVIDVVDDLGWVTASALVVLVLVTVSIELLRRRRNRRRTAEDTAAPSL